MSNQYRKKPVVIHAVQWTGDNLAEIKQFTAQLDKAGISSDSGGAFIVIPTLEGNMSANVGDWIIKGVAGEFYPCKPDIFTKTYEKVTAVNYHTTKPIVTTDPTMDKIEKQYRDIIIEQLGIIPEQVTPEAKFIDDLGADSLDSVELIIAIEEEWNIEFGDEEAEKITTVGEGLVALNEKLKAKG